MRSVKFVVSYALVLISITACAKENWVGVGGGFYVDSSSAKRTGDIGAVTIKYKSAVEWVEFDCINKRQVDDPNMEIHKNSPYAGAINIACSRWFEVWKR
jgi:hypothetical protein